MNCGYMALENLGIKVKKYFASEIDKYANQATKMINPETVFLGDVTKVSYKNGVLYWDGGQQQTKIDLILAGSPCQGFSFAGKQLNFNDERSRLFFDFIRIKKEIEAENPKLKFLLENVRMSKESEAVISRFCSIQPIFINSKLLSAQSRPRLYWTNIGTNKNNLFGIEQPGINQPKDKGILLKDILQSDVNEKYFLSEKQIKKIIINEIKPGTYCGGSRGRYKINGKQAENKVKSTAKLAVQNLELRKDKKTNCLTSVLKDNYIIIKEANKKGFVKINPGQCFDATHINSNTRRGRKMEKKCNTLTTQRPEFYKYDGLNIRRLTPLEFFRLQTIPKKYAELLLNSGISETQLYKMAGNGWTVDVISYILSHLKK